MYDVVRVPQYLTLKVSQPLFLSVCVCARVTLIVISIEDDYEEVTGESLLDPHTTLNTIDSVYCDVYSNGQPKWFVKSDNIKHLTKMILEQRPPKEQQHQQQQHQQQQQRQPKPQHVLNDTIISNDCFFKDNVIYKLR